MTTLTTYITDTRQKLQNPPAPESLYSTTSLTRWINIARGQLAGDAECIRKQGTLTLTLGQRVYDFASINYGVSATTGIAGPLSLRQVLYTVGSGQVWVTPRVFEWFTLYHLNNPVPGSGVPEEWSQYGQGSTGSFYVDKLPDDDYALTIDSSCYPIDLVDDTTVDAIPYIYSDAVSYFACYLAFLSAQSGARQADAQRMFDLYEKFRDRARRFSNSSVLPYAQNQASDPTMVNQLGLRNQGGG